MAGFFKFITDFFLKYGGIIASGFFALLGTILGWWLHRPKPELIFSSKGSIRTDKDLKRKILGISVTVFNNGNAPAFVRDVHIDGLSYKERTRTDAQNPNALDKFIHSGNFEVDTNIPAHGEKRYNAQLWYSKVPPTNVECKFFIERKQWPIIKIGPKVIKHTIFVKKVNS